MWNLSITQYLLSTNKLYDFDLRSCIMYTISSSRELFYIIFTNLCKIKEKTIVTN